MNRIFLCLLTLLIGCAKKESDKNSIESIHITEMFESRITLSRIAQIDSFKVINVGGFHDLGEVKYAFPFFGGWIIHSTSPAIVSLLNHRCEVTQQVVPDFRLGEITSIAVSDRKVFILDRTAKKIHQYNDLLQWERTVVIPVFAQSFSILRNGVVILYTGNEVTEYNQGKLVIYNMEDGMVLKDLIPVSEKLRKYFNFLTGYHFPESKGEIFFWDSAINNIYTVDEDGVQLAYQLDYGAWSLPQKFYDEADFDNAYDFVTKLRNQQYAFRHFRVLINDAFILLTFEKGGDYLTSLFNRKTGHTITFSGLTDDIQFHQSLDDIKLIFFVNLYKQSSFIGFIPVELLANTEGGINPVNDVVPGNAVLVFGRFKTF
ncbi:MAG: 6-bladed beta-propeller [Flammeovirgaceae bacterium]|nr:MAG: 6-bladed beta-propeller [Flammeovirgaceae bacterium]